MGTLSVDNIEERGTGKSQNALSGQAKAWADLDGTGTIAGRVDFNVGSYTDNGTGDFTFNFANSMSASDAYAATTATVATTSNHGAELVYHTDHSTAALAGSWRGLKENSFNDNENDVDVNVICVMGDLA